MQLQKLLIMSEFKTKPSVFILDVDGVLTTGHFIYSSEGKVMKVFGKDDSDGLNLLKQKMQIKLVSGDKTGFNISKKRAEDMNIEISLVSTVNRIDWINKNFDIANTIYMGDGIFDHYVFKKIFYSIAPNNAHIFAKREADYITASKSGNGSVAEACLHILETFFEAFNPENELDVNLNFSGNWKMK